MSKFIRTHNTEGDDAASSDDEDFDWYFPIFVFVLRDFNLQLVINKREVTADEYMEHCLRPREGDSEITKKYNLPRECIRKYFPTRHCFTLDRPVYQRHKLWELDGLPDEELSPEFVEEMTTLIDFIFTQAPVKKIETGEQINGRSESKLFLCLIANA